MSHFSVMVIGDDIEAALAPFHEFECTSNDNEYVVEIDLIEKAKQEYESSKVIRLLAPDGKLLSFFDEKGMWIPEFSQKDPNAHFSDQRTYFAPEGYKKVDVPTPLVESFPEFIASWYSYQTVPFGEEPDLENKHKFGYVQLAEDGSVEKVVKRTNPNAKWDWWVVGGRWNGFLLSKAGNKADFLNKDQIDVEKMQAETIEEAHKDYDTIMSIVGSFDGFESWEAIRNQNEDLDKAREVYNAQRVVIALKNDERTNNPFLDIEKYTVGREQFVANEADKTLTTFAIVKDGQWYEQGEMGWWATVSGDKGHKEWNKEFMKMFNELPGDTLVTIVDCHI